MSFNFNNPFLTFLEASPWVKSGDRERNKTNPCLQGAYSLVGEEASEQVLRRQGGEGMGILGTQDRALVLLPLAGTSGGHLQEPLPSLPSPHRNRNSWKAQRGRGKEKFGLKRGENETEQRSLFQFDYFF